MIIVGMGDCRTTGETCWFAKLKERFSADVFIRKGTGGATVEYLWKRWPEIIKEKPDIIVVFGGINNFKKREVSDPTQILKKVAEGMIISAKERGIIIVMCGITPFKNAKFWTEDRQRWMEEYNAWLKAYAVSQGVFFVDTVKILGEPGTYVLRKEFQRSGGGCFWIFNDAGQNEISNCIADRLTQILKEKFNDRNDGSYATLEKQICRLDSP